MQPLRSQHASFAHEEQRGVRACDRGGAFLSATTSRVFLSIAFHTIPYACATTRDESAHEKRNKASSS